MEINYCPSCGQELQQGVNYCTSCGEPITEKARSSTRDTNDITEYGQGFESRPQVVKILAVLSLIGAAVYIAEGAYLSSLAGGRGNLGDWFFIPVGVIGILSIPLAYGLLYQCRWGWRVTISLYTVYLVYAAFHLLKIVTRSAPSQYYANIVWGIPVPRTWLVTIPGIILAATVLYLLHSYKRLYFPNRTEQG